MIAETVMISIKMESFSRFWFSSPEKCMSQALAPTLHIEDFSGLYFNGPKYYLNMPVKSSLKAILGLF